jgi:hypothetical protein
MRFNLKFPHVSPSSLRFYAIVSALFSAIPFFAFLGSPELSGFPELSESPLARLKSLSGRLFALGCQVRSSRCSRAGLVTFILGLAHRCRHSGDRPNLGGAGAGGGSRGIRGLPPGPDMPPKSRPSLGRRRPAGLGDLHKVELGPCYSSSARSGPDLYSRCTE